MKILYDQLNHQEAAIKFQSNNFAAPKSKI